MEATVETTVFQTNFERMEERGTCLGCSNPVGNLEHKTRVGIEFYQCPICGTIATKNSVKSFIPDPNRKLKDFSGWKL